MSGFKTARASGAMAPHIAPAVPRSALGNHVDNTTPELAPMGACATPISTRASRIDPQAAPTKSGAPASATNRLVALLAAMPSPMAVRTPKRSTNRPPGTCATT